MYECDLWMSLQVRDLPSRFFRMKLIIRSDKANIFTFCL